MTDSTFPGATPRLADERDCLELAAAIGESVESYDSDYLLEVIIPHLQPVIGEIDALRAERDALKDEVQRLQDELTGTNEGVNDLANLRNSAEEALNDIAHFCGEGHVEHGEWDFTKSAAEIMEEWKKDRAERDALKAEVQRLRDWVMSVSNSVNIDPDHAPSVLMMISNEAAELLAASALK